jgi:peroxiredoxin family protein
MSENSNTKLTIIATKGTLDWAYPPFILGSTAAALGKDVTVFFTFYGLKLLLKDLSSIQVTPIGHPEMPMNMPMGPQWFKNIDWGPKIPNLVWQIPGIDSFATSMMKKTFKSKGVASVPELRDLCLEADCKFIACQMTVDVFGFKEDQFIDACEFGGAATYFEESNDSTKTQSLFI